MVNRYVTKKDEYKKEMENIGRCVDDKKGSYEDKSLTKYFMDLQKEGSRLRGSSQCYSVDNMMRNNCKRHEPSSHSSMEGCFDNWHDDGAKSFVDKCRDRLNASNDVSKVATVEIDSIERHSDCLLHSLDLDGQRADLDTKKKILRILEDRIYFANYCHAFV